MLVLAAVPTIRLDRLRAVAGPRFAFRAAATWETAVQAIRRGPVELAVLDPALEGQPRTQEIERIGVLFPSLPRVIYAELRAPIVPALLRLGETGIRDVIVAGYDDHQRGVTDALSAAAAGAVSSGLIDQLESQLREWPGELRWALESLFREPAAVHTVQDLADRARMDRRTCARWFTRANLPPPGVMLTAFRVVYAHRLLQDPGFTVEDVAAKLGYATVRTFTQNVRDVFDMTPGELRSSLTPDQAVEQVRSRYFRSRVPQLRIVS